MAGKEQGGDKTEMPTPKRLADARRKGDVAKSKDLTSTVTLVAWLVALSFGATIAMGRLSALFDDGFQLVSRDAPFAEAAGALGWSAFLALMLLSAVVLLPAAITGVVAEFLQTGGVFSTEKLKPKMENLNPAEGFKRMFSMDNLVELVKTLAKAALVLFVVWLVLRATLPDIVQRAGPMLAPQSSADGAARAGAVLGFAGGLVRTILTWTLSAFLLVAVLDMGWQRHSYIKKLKMSLRDIRDEHKENEGDPLIKSNRRQLHEEWASQNAVGAVRQANVLVVNPTHLAIALAYDPASQPVPIMTAKGEGPLAQAMRAAAEEEGVPIIRHVPVARKLWEDGAVDELIPRDMFEAIAQIILWAQKLRDGGAGDGSGGAREMDLETSPDAPIPGNDR